MVIKNYKLFERGDEVQDDSPSEYSYDEVDLSVMYSEKGYDRTFTFLKDIFLDPKCKIFWRGHLIIGVDEYKFFDNKTKSNLQITFLDNGVSKTVVNPSGSVYIKKSKSTSQKISKPPDFIMGIPSGEIIDMDSNNIKLLKDRKLVGWVYSYGGHVLNCYVYNDNDYIKIDNFLKSLKKEDPKIVSICNEFQSELSMIFQNKKTFSIAYLKLDHYYFYAIVPDLISNREYYKPYEKRISEVLLYMKAIHEPHSFNVIDKVQSNNSMKYYEPPVKNKTWFDRYSDLI